MKTRTRSALAMVAIGALLSPAGAVAQEAQAEGRLEYVVDITCEFGQGSPRDLPTCEEIDGTGAYLTMRNLARMTGSFDGLSVLDAVVLKRASDGGVEFTGEALFSGDVEGCGTGTVYFDVVGEAVTNEDQTNTYTVNTQTAVPGGTLPLSGTLDMTGREMPQDDGTTALGYAGSYSCG